VCCHSDHCSLIGSCVILGILQGLVHGQTLQQFTRHEPSASNDCKPALVRALVQQPTKAGWAGGVHNLPGVHSTCIAEETRGLLGLGSVNSEEARGGLILCRLTWMPHLLSCQCCAQYLEHG
jgi:hypothetical protein